MGGQLLVLLGPSVLFVVFGAYISAAGTLSPKIAPNSAVYLVLACLVFVAAGITLIDCVRLAINVPPIALRPVPWGEHPAPWKRSGATLLIVVAGAVSGCLFFH